MPRQFLSQNTPIKRWLIAICAGFIFGLAPIAHALEPERGERCDQIIRVVDQKTWRDRALARTPWFGTRGRTIYRSYTQYKINGERLYIQRVAGGGSASDLYSAVTAYPDFFFHYKIQTLTIHAQAYLTFLDTSEFNQVLDALDGTAYAKPFRFKDWRSVLFYNQKYPALQFLKQIAKGNILLATKSYYFEHDRAEDHIVAALIMPPEIFNFYRGRVRVWLAIRKIFPRSNRRFNKAFAQATSDLAAVWDHQTARAGFEFVQGRPEQIAAAFDDIQHPQSFAIAGTAGNFVDHVFEFFKKNGVAITDEQKIEIVSLCKKWIPPRLSRDQIRAFLKNVVTASVRE